MKNNKIVRLIVLITVLIALSFVLFYGVKYITNKKVMGHYELVEGEGEKELDINFTTWSEGRKENLECDLWNCGGYEYGKYYIKGNKIEFHFHSTGYNAYEYEVIEENGETYLILKDKYIDKIKTTKYRKIK